MSTSRIGGGAALGRGFAVVAALGLVPAAVWAVPVDAAAYHGRPVAPRAAGAGVISRFAGGVGGPARGTSVMLGGVYDVSYADGSVYAATGSVVRQVSEATGMLTTPAGIGDLYQITPPLGDGGLATNASLGDASGVAVGQGGSLVISDAGHERIRVVAAATGTFYGRAMTAHHIYTVAGNGREGDSGDGGPATSAEFNGPADVVTDAAGNLVIPDGGNNQIRVVAEATGTFYGQAMTAGDIYTVAGGLGELGDVAVDGAGNLLIADGGANQIVVLAAKTGTFYGQAMTAGDIYTVAGDGTGGDSGDGGPATSAELLSPAGVAVDGSGNVLIADTANDRIRMVAEHTGTYYGQAMTAGDIYTVAGISKDGFSGDGGPATLAEIAQPDAVAVDGAGNLVIADTYNNRVRVVAASTGNFYGQAMTAGDIYTVAGTGKPDISGIGGRATSAEFTPSQNPEDPGIVGVAVDAAGNLVMTSGSANRVLVVAASTGTSYGQAMIAGRLYSIAGDGGQGYRGDGRPATGAEFYDAWGVAVDGSGNVLIADTDNNRIRMVAERTGTYYGQAMTAGDIYTVAGNGHYGYTGDGGPATSAELYIPAGVAVDSNGNLIIADTGNGAIRVVAASTGTFYGQAMTAGDIYTIAGNGRVGYSGDGGPATSASLHVPQTARVDAAGNVVIADTSNDRVRVIAEHTGTYYGQAMTAGDIYTVAGDGSCTANADGIPATTASICSPGAVAVDAAGNLVITDAGHDRVRVVAESNGTFYGQAMTAGDIYTVAGNGVAGCGGNGGPATGAQLGFPQDVTVNSAGDLLIGQVGCEQIRMVTGGPSDAGGPGPG